MKSRFNSDASVSHGITLEVFNRYKTGDVSSFNLIYHAYYVLLSTTAFYYVHDYEVAGQIVNDVFVSFWEKRKSITFPPLSILRVAVRNACISYLRSSAHNNKEKNVLIEDGLWQFLDDTESDADSNPLHELLENERQELVRKAVEKLPFKCRSVFIACMYEKKSYREIAEEQNLTESTVRVQLMNAIKKLRDILVFFE